MITDAALSPDEIIDAIERDLPGFEWLMRSNLNTHQTDVTGSAKKYFVNIMSPDFTGHVLLTPLGYVDVSPGERFTAYADTRADALAQAYEKAVARYHGG